MASIYKKGRMSPKKTPTEIPNVPVFPGQTLGGYVMIFLKKKVAFSSFTMKKKIPFLYAKLRHLAAPADPGAEATARPHHL